MKLSQQLSRVDDSDIYFAVAFILLAFDKFEWGMIAACVGCFCVFCKRVAERKEKKEMTNGDKIRSMDNEQLAQILAAVCPPGNGESRLTCVSSKSCGSCWLEWLGKEVEK